MFDSSSTLNNREFFSQDRDQKPEMILATSSNKNKVSNPTQKLIARKFASTLSSMIDENAFDLRKKMLEWGQTIVITQRINNKITLNQVRNLAFADLDYYNHDLIKHLSSDIERSFLIDDEE